LALSGVGCGSSSSSSGTGGGGGSATGGAAGSAGGGVSGGAGVDGGALASCGVTEAEPNDTRDKAVPYTLGTPVVGCVGSETDVDFYEFTAPAGDAAGGYFLVGVEDVSSGYTDLAVYSGSDNALIHNEYTVESGGPLHLYFAGAPGQTYRATVKNFSAFTEPHKYTLKITYTKVPDAFEPNDTRAMAKPITVGTPVMAYLYTGYRSSMLAPAEYMDWYTVQLAAGTATVKFSDPPPDVRGDVHLLNSDGEELAGGSREYTLTSGANVTVSMKAVTAGTYFVSVGIFSSAPDAAGAGIKPPALFSQPYTLTVSQP